MSSASSDEEDLGACDDNVPSPSAEGKWWHVPDDHIEALVERRRQPREHPGHQATTARTAPARTATTVSKRSQVRFDGQLAGEGDALDSLLRRTQERIADSGLVGKPWQVSDEQLRDLVLTMAASPPPPQRAPEPARAGPDAKLVTSRSKLSLAGGGALRAGVGASKSQSALRRADERINVWIYIMQSEDAMRLRVSPDLPIGPARPPPSNPFTDMFGQAANTKGFDKVRHAFDCKRRAFSDVSGAAAAPGARVSLKSLIEDFAEIEVARQRLLFRQIPMTDDEVTLRSFGVQDGDTIALRIQRWVPGCASGGRDLLLASTKKLETDETSGAGKYDGYTMRACRHIDQCRKVDGDVYMQPKWISEKNPRLFAKVGIAVDGTGSHKAKDSGVGTPIWLQDRGDEKLQRVRKVVAGRTG